jgi:DNA/RNA-binding domain of Phe-tRNA-synthetase-like protein
MKNNCSKLWRKCLNSKNASPNNRRMSKKDCGTYAEPMIWCREHAASNHIILGESVSVEDCLNERERITLYLDNCATRLLGVAMGCEGYDVERAESLAHILEDISNAIHKGEHWQDAE